MNNAKKLMGLALLANLFSFGSALGLGIRVINTVDNPYQLAYPDWSQDQLSARKTICVSFGSAMGEKCTTIDPIYSQEKNENTFYPGTPSKLFVSTVASDQATHKPNAFVFDLDAARKQYGEKNNKLSINSIHVVAVPASTDHPQGTMYIVLNNNPQFVVNPQK